MTSAVMPTYRRAELAFTHGEGCRLFDRAGRGWLDFTGGIAVCALGHAHPKLVRALFEQSQRLWHCSNLFEVEGQERVAQLGAGHAERGDVERVDGVDAALDERALAQLMTWFGVACELHRDWRNDIEGLGQLFSNNIPDYRNLINSYMTLTANK